MSLWGKSTSAESRPKFLPIDSNAQGSSGSRQDAIAIAGGLKERASSSNWILVREINGKEIQADKDTKIYPGDVLTIKPSLFQFMSTPAIYPLPENDSFDLADFISFLWLKKWRIILTTILLTSIGVMYVKNKPKIYSGSNFKNECF